MLTLVCLLYNIVAAISIDEWKVQHQLRYLTSSPAALNIRRVLDVQTNPTDNTCEIPFNDPTQTQPSSFC